MTRVSRPAAAAVRRRRRAADLVERLLRQADRGERAAEAAVPQLGRQRLRRGVAGRQLAAQRRWRPASSSRRASSNGTSTRSRRAGVELERRAAPGVPNSSSSSSPWAQSWTASLSQAVGLPSSSRGAEPCLVSTGYDVAALLLDQVEDAGDAERLGGERDAAACGGVAVLAGLVGQVRRRRRGGGRTGRPRRARWSASRSRRTGGSRAAGST